jgi:hypothetical protein
LNKSKIIGISKINERVAITSSQNNNPYLKSSTTHDYTIISIAKKIRAIV